MLASSRVPDVDVYAEVAALKRSHVSRTELSSLDVTETTIPLSHPQIYCTVIGADVFKSCSGSILYPESKFPVTVVLLELA